MGWVEVGKGEINGIERDFTFFGQWAHNGVCRGCFVEWHTQNLFGFVNLCHPNELQKKREPGLEW